MEATWAKVKFDRQIVAIAKVARATEIYSDDTDVRSLAIAEDITVIGLAELPTPPERAQIEMQLEPRAQEIESAPVEPPDDEATARDESTEESEPEST